MSHTLAFGVEAAYYVLETCLFKLSACSKVFISFGGLLLLLDGPYKNLTGLRIDYVYLCLKK